MTRFESSIPPTYFDDMYAQDPDPWRFEVSPYERDKYMATLAALPRQTYEAGFEVGCSIGVLTQSLAARCRSLLAVDVAASALERAALRCEPYPHVSFEQMRIPHAWPDRSFDLVVLSEVVYYLDATDVKRLATRLRASAQRGCDLVLVHWTGATHYPLSGDEAAEQLIAALGNGASRLHQAVTGAYRLDVLRMDGAPRNVDDA